MRTAIILALLVAGFPCFSQKADIILYNGKIFTGESKEHFVEAVAIKGDKILQTGSTETIKKLETTGTNSVDLKGGTVIPGINDAHVHVGVRVPAYEFSFTQTPNDPIPWARVRDSLQDIVKRVPKETIIRSEINEEILDDDAVRRRLLDSIAPYNPVILYAWTGHGYICNSAALKLLGYNNDSEFLGGKVGLYPDGTLNGLLTEYAGYRVSQLLASTIPYEAIEEQVAGFYKSAIAFGITSMQVMTTSLPEQTFTRLYTTNDFGTRNRLISFPLTSKISIEYTKRPEAKILSKKNYSSGIKLIIDGTPIERLAAISAPYSDDPGKYGEINFSEDILRRFVETCIINNQQLLVHTSGDSAINTVLRRLTYENSADYWKAKRPRLEHADLAIMNEHDYEKIKRLGVIIVPNPAHFAMPGLMTQRFGSRSKYIQALKSLLKENIPVAFGSDGPLNPYLNIMFAVVHPTNPAESISVAEAVIIYTYGSAFAEHKENVKGKLVKGQLADLAVLSQDIFTISTNALPATKSIMTIVGGKILYDQRTVTSK